MGGDFFNFHAALSRSNKNRFLKLAVNEEPDIELLNDIEALLNEDFAHRSSGRPGLLGDQTAADHKFREVTDIVQTAGKLDTAAFASPAGMNLGLNRPDLSADFFGNLSSFLRT